jgi:8-hydroxy-5-deazaflavin:NADPH oxidoreductase
MDVAIIGTGNVGGALARALSSAGHFVTVTSTTPEEAEARAGEVGGKAVPSNAEAASAGDVVILAVPYRSVDQILDEIAGVIDGKIVLDVTNRSDENAGLVVDGTSNAEQIQARVPNVKVVKAFNTVLASHQNDPTIDGVALDGFVAATDEQAKQAVLDLVGSIGLRPIDAGPLEVARILEAMGALNVSLNMRNNWAWNNGWKLLEPGS